MTFVRNSDHYFSRAVFRSVTLVSVALTFLACANSSPKTEHISSSIAESLALEARVNAAAQPGRVQAKELPVPNTPQQRFDVSVNQVPAKIFFTSLVSDAGVNVVAHPEVAGRITLELKNVTIDEVLSVTRDVFGYEYRFSNSIYTIYPRKLRTEIFPINYLDVKRVGVTDTSVQIGQITGSSDNGGRTGGSRGGSSGGSAQNEEGANLLEYIADEEGGKGSGESITPGARVQTLSTTDFWGGVRDVLRSIVGENDGRMVMVNPQAGLVVVKAMPNELSAVREFLEKSELSIKRQVVLETKILEVRLNDGFEAGINWGAITGAISASQEDFSTGSLADIVFNGESTRESMISSVLNVSDITKLLFLLDRQGEVQVLSSPRISTVNNQKAVIRVGTDEFFVTGISNSTTASASSVVNTPEVLLDSFFSGIALDVTPQISEDGSVILHVHPIVTNVQDQIKEIDIAGENFSLPLALRDVRESDSIVKARSGQVVVLGGLMQETLSDVTSKRAFLGDIPGLNLLFKAKQKAKVKTELVILMQPIVVENDTWSQALKSQVDRLNTISGSR